MVITALMPSHGRLLQNFSLSTPFQKNGKDFRRNADESKIIALPPPLGIRLQNNLQCSKPKPERFLSGQRLFYLRAVEVIS